MNFDKEISEAKIRLRDHIEYRAKQEMYLINFWYYYRTSGILLYNVNL
jgi:hypothetical protein